MSDRSFGMNLSKGQTTFFWNHKKLDSKTKKIGIMRKKGEISFDPGQMHSQVVN
jgi:hypothetical protein